MKISHYLSEIELKVEFNLDIDSVDDLINTNSFVSVEISSYHLLIGDLTLNKIELYHFIRHTNKIHDTFYFLLNQEQNLELVCFWKNEKGFMASEKFAKNFGLKLK